MSTEKEPPQKNKPKVYFDNLDYADHEDAAQDYEVQKLNNAKNDEQKHDDIGYTKTSIKRKLIDVFRKNKVRERVHAELPVPEYKEHCHVLSYQQIALYEMLVKGKKANTTLNNNRKKIIENLELMMDQRLSNQHRIAMKIMHSGQELSKSECARALGWSVTTFNDRYNKALSICKEILLEVNINKDDII